MRHERQLLGISDNSRRLHKRYRELTGKPISRNELRLETKRQDGDRTGALQHIVLREELKHQDSAKK